MKRKKEKIDCFWVSTPYATCRVDVKENIIQSTTARYYKKYYGWYFVDFLSQIVGCGSKDRLRIKKLEE